MSVQATQWAAEQTTGSPMAKLVLFVLADHANREGAATTSVTTLARKTEASRATVKRALALLAERGLIARARRQRSTGADTSNSYRLRLDSPHATVPDRATVTPSLTGHQEPDGGQTEPPPVSQGHPRSLTQNPYAGVTVNPQGEPAVLNRTTEPKSGYARIHTRGTATPADLAATAVRPDAYRLVAAWREQTGAAYRPATIRSLAKLADTLLRDGGNPTAVRAALDEWDRRPDARPGLLPYLYDDAVKAARLADQPATRAPRSARGDKVRGWLALAEPALAEHVERLAVEGGRS